MSPSGFSSPLSMFFSTKDVHYGRTTLDYAYRAPNQIIVENLSHERGRDLHPPVPLAVVSALRDV